MIRRNNFINQEYDLNEDKDRWMVSYADFMTLLFAFFVVMYSVSQINEGKYRVLSESLDAAFLGHPYNWKPTTKNSETVDHFFPVLEPSNVSNENIAKTDQSNEANNLSLLKSKLTNSFKELEKNGSVGIQEIDGWVEIAMNSELLFSSANSAFSENAQTILKELATILKDSNNYIKVIGYTDSEIIESNIYPSNWELSSARSAAVVRFFYSEGINPHRMKVVGYGQYQPLASNRNLEGRRQNRRVTVAISESIFDLASLEKYYEQLEAKADQVEKEIAERIAMEIAENEALKREIEERIAKEKEPKIKVVRLPGGGIKIISGKKD